MWGPRERGGPLQKASYAGGRWPGFHFWKLREAAAAPVEGKGRSAEQEERRGKEALSGAPLFWAEIGGCAETIDEPGIGGSTEETGGCGGEI
uniref:Uncharacterized protein n=1 Tax=Oryza punctata TaxID=4537 RepID=A0A0E0MG65_ORYPU